MGAGRLIRVFHVDEPKANVDHVANRITAHTPKHLIAVYVRDLRREMVLVAVVANARVLIVAGHQEQAEDDDK